MNIKNIIHRLDVPFDLVLFPSLGLFYDNKKSGVLVKYLTGLEENILTAPMLASTSTALDMILKSVIIDDDIETDDLLVGDKNAILLFLRSTSYGDSYTVLINCPECSFSGKSTFSISSMEAKDIVIPPDEKREFTFTLPKMKIEESKVVIKFRPMTFRDEKILYSESTTNDSDIKISSIVTSKFSNQITSINGIKNKKFITKFISKIPIKDSSALREYMEKVEPGINSEVNLNCSNCKYSFKENICIDSKFLGYTPEYKDALLNEVFLLYYYGKGITRNEAFSIATVERRWAIQRINEEIEKRNKAENDASEAAKRRKK